jgi:hypothetical protein
MKKLGLILCAVSGAALLNTACRSDSGTTDSGSTDTGLITPADATTGSNPDAANSNPGMDATTGNADATSPTPDGGTTGQMTTVQNAMANTANFNLKTITISNAVAIATSSSANGPYGDVYIQDIVPAAAGPGIHVHISKNDATVNNVPFPNVGDVMTITGRFSNFDGSWELASSTTHHVAMSITITTPATGMVSGGAYPPAGMALTGTAAGAYNHNNLHAHDDQVGNVVKIPGPLTVTATRGFVNTSSTGTTRTEGFAITGGVWVDDKWVYKDCIKTLDGGVLDLTNGITGVWDRYQDYYASPNHDSPKFPVLQPVHCGDVNR